MREVKGDGFSPLGLLERQAEIERIIEDIAQSQTLINELKRRKEENKEALKAIPTPQMTKGKVPDYLP